MMKELIDSLHNGRELERGEIQASAAALLGGETPVAEKAGFLKALAAKGETPAEIAGFVEAFLARTLPVPVSPGELDGPLIDVCGTGGDKLNLFNISTASIFILAAAGVCVAKHGNRGITSKSGGADVLEALGVPIDLHPDAFAECLRRHGAGFMFAQKYHPAFKAVAPVRKQLAEEGVRTVFNILGPLLNPIPIECQMVGVMDPELPPAYIRILERLGRKSAWVVHGSTDDGRGMDEISSIGPTRVCRLQEGRIDETTLSPSCLGIPPAKVGDLMGGSAEENAAIIRAILTGGDTGPKRDIVLLNAAGALTVAGVAEDVQQGMHIAREQVDSGKAREKLEALTGFPG